MSNFNELVPEGPEIQPEIPEARIKEKGALGEVGITQTRLGPSVPEPSQRGTLLVPGLPTRPDQYNLVDQNNALYRGGNFELAEAVRYGYILVARYAEKHSGATS